MEMLAVGKVTVSARIENLADLIRSQAGDIPRDAVRAIDVEDALVDIPLEALDFVVDPTGQKLLGNPEHGGQHMIDLF